MPYRFVTQSGDYRDLASGKVLYHLPGHPAFPVRLASEIFQRAVLLLDQDRDQDRIRIYDPCCGNAYLLTVLGFLHGDRISDISASDIDSQALSIARRNLSLLTPEGLEVRRAEITALKTRFGKDSHKQALESVERLGTRLEEIYRIHAITTNVFLVDALHPQALQNHFHKPDRNLVITDIPYGRISTWKTSGASQDLDQEPAWVLLERLRRVLLPGAIIAVASAKEQKIRHASYTPAGKMRSVGKRLVTFLRLF